MNLIDRIFNYKDKETLYDENKQAKKILKRLNKDMLDLLEERDNLKTDMIDILKKRTDDFDLVVYYQEQYKEVYNSRKEIKRELAEIKNELNSKNDIIEDLEKEIKRKDKKIKLLEKDDKE